MSLDAKLFCQGTPHFICLQTIFGQHRWLAGILREILTWLSILPFLTTFNSAKTLQNLRSPKRSSQFNSENPISFEDLESWIIYIATFLNPPSPCIRSSTFSDRSPFATCQPNTPDYQLKQPSITTKQFPQQQLAILAPTATNNPTNSPRVYKSAKVARSNGANETND